MNTFDQDNEPGLFEEPRRRPPRDRERRPQQRSGPRRRGPQAGSNSVLRLAGLIVLGLAIVLGLVLSCSGASKGDYSSYVNAITPLAQDSASVGDKFEAVLGTSGLTMQTLESDLMTWSKQEEADYVAAQRLQPPGPLQSAHAEALATFYLREAALTGLANTFTVAKRQHESAFAASDALAGDAQLLSASDVDWAQLYQAPATQTLTAENVTGLIVPKSQIVTNPDIVSQHSLAILYERVGTSSRGGHGSRVHGDALISATAVYNGTTTPLSTTTATTISSGSALVIDAVVEDSGDFPEVNVAVTLTIKVSGQPKYTQTQKIAQIAAHQQETVSFTNLQLPNSALSHNADLSVDVKKVPGEAKVDNNSATYPVFFLLGR